MQITIITDDKTVYCAGIPVPLPNIDWSRFDGDPASPWDDIHAVQYNTDDEMGHVEYKVVKTKPPVRPDIKPGDWRITKADFEANFAWVLPHYEAEKERLDAAAAAAAAAAERAAQEAAAQAEAARRLAIERASLPRDPAEIIPAASEDVEAMKQLLAQQAAELEALKSQVAVHGQVFEGINKVIPGGTE